MSLTFTFRERDHTYWLDREPVMGCTEVLKTLGILDDQWYEDRATERGHVVHLAAAAKDRRLRKRVRLPESWRGYVTSWQAYVDAWVAQWLLIEQPLCDLARRVAGRPDRVAIISAPGVRPHIGIPDLKTGDVEPWHPLQGSIYALLVQTWVTAKRAELRRLYGPTLDLDTPPVSYGVYVRSDGKPPKIRAFPFEPSIHALITAAQVKRSLLRTR